MTREKWPCEEHPMYTRWLAITQRCTNPNCSNYPNYGARGITLAEDLRAFEDFAAYVESLPNYGEPKSTLDRIENGKGYERGNLRWVSQSIQLANQRFSGKGSNKYTGVNWSKVHLRWVARVTLEGKQLLSKTFVTQQEAVEYRNQFIKDNNLPHTIQDWVGE